MSFVIYFLDALPIMYLHIIFIPVFSGRHQQVITLTLQKEEVVIHAVLRFTLLQATIAVQ